MLNKILLRQIWTFKFNQDWWTYITINIFRNFKWTMTFCYFLHYFQHLWQGQLHILYLQDTIPIEIVKYMPRCLDKVFEAWLTRVPEPHPQLKDQLFAKYWNLSKERFILQYSFISRFSWYIGRWANYKK